VFLAAVTVRRTGTGTGLPRRPSLALIACELLIKPWVGRSIGGSFSYPSGSTVGLPHWPRGRVGEPESLASVTAVVATLFACDDWSP